MVMTNMVRAGVVAVGIFASVVASRVGEGPRVLSEVGIGPRQAGSSARMSRVGRDARMAVLRTLGFPAPFLNWLLLGGGGSGMTILRAVSA